MTPVPVDPQQLFLAITEQHVRTMSALTALLSPPPDAAARAELHRKYREAAAGLLELERQHNESGRPRTPPTAEP